MPPAIAGATALTGVRSAAVVKRRIVITPGIRYPYDAREWTGALVIVERGVVDLEWPTGAARFATGSALWLADLPLLALHASGPEPAVLVALTRSTGS